MSSYTSSYGGKSFPPSHKSAAFPSKKGKGLDKSSNGGNDDGSDQDNDDQPSGGLRCTNCPRRRKGCSAKSDGVYPCTECIQQRLQCVPETPKVSKNKRGRKITGTRAPRRGKQRVVAREDSEEGEQDVEGTTSSAVEGVEDEAAEHQEVDENEHQSAPDPQDAATGYQPINPSNAPAWPGSPSAGNSEETERLIADIMAIGAGDSNEDDETAAQLNLRTWWDDARDEGVPEEILTLPETMAVYWAGRWRDGTLPDRFLELVRGRR